MPLTMVTSRLLGEAFREFRDDPEMRVAIISTAGDKFFCAAGTEAAAAGDAVDGDYGVGFGGIQELRGLNKPVIAATTAWRLVVVLNWRCRPTSLRHDHSSFALPKSRQEHWPMRPPSSCPNVSSSHRHGNALSRALDGRSGSQTMGLVNELFPSDQLMDHVWSVARELASGPPLVFAAIKQVAREAEAMTFRRQ